jgi:hypothetical protein
MAIIAVTSNKEARITKKSFLFFLKIEMCLPESDIPVKLRLSWVILATSMEKKREGYEFLAWWCLAHI